MLPLPLSLPLLQSLVKQGNASFRVPVVCRSTGGCCALLMVALQKWTVLPCYHEPLDMARSCRNLSFCSLAACFSDSIMPGPPAHEMGCKTSLAHVFTCIRRGRWIRLLSEMTDASRSKADVAGNFPPWLCTLRVITASTILHRRRVG